MPDYIKQIQELLDQASTDERRQVFHLLRPECRIHPVEDRLGIEAEIILEAVDRAQGMSERGLRGLIAEATFKMHAIDKLEGWHDITPGGNHAFDFLIERGGRRVSIQLKMQRKKNGKPMRANKGYKFLSAAKYVTETQRSRRGVDKDTGEDTRPYRFGEYDILAVSMEPATGDWSVFRYTLERWLLPRDDKKLVLKFQPVPLEPDDDWADNLATCIEWLDSGEHKTIAP